ncbi:PTS IIA-like nitrogen-regulatory protein PtsN [Mergibacter septicus]|uniref:PTS IIA-like nitrogen regulatory protein PtsN n=1 Tax=Mergibacter septicus TaxID=221402 RepID=UPI0011793462|nr:PTS IIA-like nitrogen regulatory protein PtsN [Mergibacter septicus]AWX14446.1 PTS IIA-like nitrogen-regulatory protein PtsN [Mergibacter septicus]
MQITQLLDINNIRQGLISSSKKRIFELIANLIAEQTGDDPIACFEALCTREKMGNTGINNGIAIPHAKLPQGDNPIAVFCQLENPIEYEAPDHRQVDLIFAVMIPEACCGKCASILPSLAERLSDKNLCKQLRAASNIEEIWTAFTLSDQQAVAKEKITPTELAENDTLVGSNPT